MKLRERICGAAVGEFRAGEAVALWSVSGAERAAEGALIGNCHPRAKMGRLAALGSFFVIPQSTRWQAAGRALRVFAALVPWRSHVESRALRADIRAHFVAKKFPSWSKNDAPGFATPLALSKSGAYSELFKIRKCLKLLSI